MKWTKPLSVFSMLTLLFVSLGGCHYPYYRHDYDAHRRDRWHDRQDYRDRDYDRYDRDRDRDWGRW